MGVSEDLAPLNTRMILEKGLRLFGSSRSGRKDFLGLINLYKENPDVVNQLEKIVGAEIHVKIFRTSSVLSKSIFIRSWEKQL